MFVIPKDTYNVKTTAKKGRGVFVTKDIPAGTVIGDYLGILRRAEDEDESSAGLYTFSINEKVDVYPEPKSIGVHLINHSCMPNCDVYSLNDHILYVATRKIFKGEELTIDYSLDTIDDEDTRCPHVCHCGTVLCRGTMHVSKEAQARWETMLPAEGRHKGITSALGDFGTMLQPLSRYPKTVSDHLIWDIVPNQKKAPVVAQNGAQKTKRGLRALMRETGRPVAIDKDSIALAVVSGIFLVKRKR